MSSADLGESRTQARFGEVFANAEFRAVWFAQLASVAGEQLAKVALALLVFERTASAGLAALTYALTLVPDLLGGPLLSWLADRVPRRRLMVACDLIRAGLVALMATSGAPLWVLCGLLVLVQLLQSPHTAARAALLVTVVKGDGYLAASAITNATNQFGQLTGFAVGGALVAAIGPTESLLIEAGAFLVSAALTRFGVRERRVVADDGVPVPARERWWSPITAGATLVLADPKLRILVAFGCLSGFYVAKDGLAVPFADALGYGATGAGLLLAASPAGAVVGMVLLTRYVRPATRLRLLGPLAVASCAVLIGTAAGPGLAITWALWAVSGLCSAFQVPANAAFVQAVPDAMRGQAFGFAATAVRVAQGLGVALAGFAADHVSPPFVIAGFAVLGVAVSGLTALRWANSSAGGRG